MDSPRSSSSMALCSPHLTLTHQPLDRQVHWQVQSQVLLWLPMVDGGAPVLRRRVHARVGAHKGSIASGTIAVVGTLSIADCDDLNPMNSV